MIGRETQETRRSYWLNICCQEMVVDGGDEDGGGEGGGDGSRSGGMDGGGRVGGGIV